jgi:hypothetical protein
MAVPLEEAALPGELSVISPLAQNRTLGQVAMETVVDVIAFLDRRQSMTPRRWR